MPDESLKIKTKQQLLTNKTKKEMKEKFNFDESLKAAAVQYRGVYQNTILDWQPNEEHGYPEGNQHLCKRKRALGSLYRYFL